MKLGIFCGQALFGDDDDNDDDNFKPGVIESKRGCLVMDTISSCVTPFI